jgi:hypothetical protein
MLQYKFNKKKPCRKPKHRWNHNNNMLLRDTRSEKVYLKIEPDGRLEPTK